MVLGKSPYQCTCAVLQHLLDSKWKRPKVAETRTAGTFRNHENPWFFRRPGRAVPEETAGSGITLYEIFETMGI